MSDEFEPNPTLARLYPEAAVGGYTQLDGQVEFYTRVNALVDQDSHVLDFGAGRGQWAVDPMPAISRRLRMLRGRVARVVGTDVDEAVLTNPSLDEAKVVAPGEPLPYDDGTFDLVIADHVLEHVDAEHAPERGRRDDAAAQARRLAGRPHPQQVGDDRHRRARRTQQAARAGARPAPARPQGRGRLPGPLRDEHPQGPAPGCSRRTRCTSTGTPASRRTSAARPRCGGWPPGSTGSPRRGCDPRSWSSCRRPGRRVEGSR